MNRYFTVYDNLENHCTRTWNFHGQIDFGNVIRLEMTNKKISSSCQDLTQLSVVTDRYVYNYKTLNIYTSFCHKHNSNILLWCGCTCMFWLYLQAVNYQECTYVLTIWVTDNSTQLGPVPTLLTGHPFWLVDRSGEILKRQFTQTKIWVKPEVKFYLQQLPPWVRYYLQMKARIIVQHVGR